MAEEGWLVSWIGAGVEQSHSKMETFLSKGPCLYACLMNCLLQVFFYCFRKKFMQSAQKKSLNRSHPSFYHSWPPCITLNGCVATNLPMSLTAFLRTLPLLSCRLCVASSVANCRHFGNFCSRSQTHRWAQKLPGPVRVSLGPAQPFPAIKALS